MNGYRASSWVWLLHCSSQLIISLNCLHLGQEATEGIANSANLGQVLCRPPPASALTVCVPWPGPTVLPWVTESKPGQPGEEEERPQHAQGGIWPLSLRRIPMRKLALRKDCGRQLKALMEGQQAWGAASMPGWWLLCRPFQGRTPGWTAFKIHPMLTQMLPEHSGNLSGQSPLCQPETLPRPLLPSGSSREGGAWATPSHLELLRMTISLCQVGTRA